MLESWNSFSKFKEAPAFKSDNTKLSEAHLFQFQSSFWSTKDRNSSIKLNIYVEIISFVSSFQVYTVFSIYHWSVLYDCYCSEYFVQVLSYLKNENKKLRLFSFPDYHRCSHYSRFWTDEQVIQKGDVCRHGKNSI